MLINQEKLEEYKNRAEQGEGEARAQYIVGWIYSNDIEKQNYDEAAKYYRLSIKNDRTNIEALLDFSQLLLYGKVRHLPDDISFNEIQQLLKSAYDLTSEGAKQRGRVSFLLSQVYKKSNVTLSKGYMREALRCKDSIAENCYGLELVDQKKIQQGLVYLNYSASRGNAYSAFNIAVLIEAGKITSYGNALVKENYLKAAELGLVEAMFQVGYCFEEESNTTKAAKWYFKAAERGHFLAAAHYAYLIFKNPDCKIQQDDHDPAYWFSLSFQGNDKKAYYYYALYQKEKKNYLLALKYFQHCLDEKDDEVFLQLIEMIRLNKISDSQGVSQCMKNLTDLATREKNDSRLYLLALTYIDLVSISEHNAHAENIFISLANSGHERARSMLMSLNSGAQTNQPVRRASTQLHASSKVRARTHFAPRKKMKACDETIIVDSSMLLTPVVGGILDRTNLAKKSINKGRVKRDADETLIVDLSMELTGLASMDVTNLSSKSMDMTGCYGDDLAFHDDTADLGSSMELTENVGNVLFNEELEQSILEIKTQGVSRTQRTNNTKQMDKEPGTKNHFGTTIPDEVEDGIEYGSDTIVIDKMLIYLVDGQAIVITQTAESKTTFSMNVDNRDQSFSNATPRTTARSLIGASTSTPRRTGSRKRYSKRRGNEELTPGRQAFSDVLNACPTPAVETRVLAIPAPIQNQITMQQAISTFSNVLSQYSSLESSITQLPKNLMRLFKDSIFKLDSAELALRENIQSLANRYAEKKGTDCLDAEELIGRTRKSTNTDFVNVVTIFSKNAVEDARVLKRFAGRHDFSKDDDKTFSHLSSQIMLGMYDKQDDRLRVRDFYRPLVSVVKVLLEMGQELVERRNQLVTYLTEIDQYSSSLSETAKHISAVNDSFENIRVSANAKKVHVKELAIVSDQSSEQLSSALLQDISKVKAIESGLKHIEAVQQRQPPLGAVQSSELRRSQQKIDFFGQSGEKLASKYLSSVTQDSVQGVVSSGLEYSSTITNEFLCENLTELEKELVDAFFWCAIWLSTDFKSRDWRIYARQDEVDAGKVYQKVPKEGEAPFILSSENVGGMLQTFFLDIKTAMTTAEKRKSFGEYQGLTIVSQKLQEIVGNLFGQYNSLLLLAMRETVQFEKTYRDVEGNLQKFLTNFSFGQARMFKMSGETPGFRLPDPYEVLGIKSDDVEAITDAISPRKKRPASSLEYQGSSNKVKKRKYLNGCG